jgi:tetratricopeptide (TPR) repeat protein
VTYGGFRNPRFRRKQPGCNTDAESQMAKVTSRPSRDPAHPASAAAAAGFRAALARDPASFADRLGLGLARLAQGHDSAAAAELKRAVAARPEDARAQAALGLAFARLGRAEASAPLQRATLLAPDDAQVQLHIGLAEASRGGVLAAAHHLRRAVALDPACEEGHGALVRLLAAHPPLVAPGGPMPPETVIALYRRGLDCNALGRFDEAAACFARGMELAVPQTGLFCLGLAQTRHLQGRGEDARALAYAALARGVDAAECYVRAGVFHRAQGNFEAAADALARAVMLRPTHGHAQLRLTLLRQAQDPAARIEELGQLCATPGLDAENHATLRFALAREIEATGAHDAAFAAYRRANDLRAAQFPTDPRAYDADARSEGLDAAFFAARRDLGDPSARPVFVVGMMRSGTTLVEQILASHSAVRGHGELTDIRQFAYTLPQTLGAPYPDCLAQLDAPTARSLAALYLARLDRDAPQAVRSIDKLPHNFEHLGLIALLFPNARIIHCTRDKRDTCLSNYFLDFGAQNAFTYDLAALDRYWRHYQRLMTHWQAVLPNPILTVPYEALVTEPEAWSRRMVAFLGLEWDERCLAPHETRRPVYTESLWQVRQPINAGAIGRSAPYAAHLAALAEEERSGAVPPNPIT